MLLPYPLEQERMRTWKHNGDKVEKKDAGALRPVALLRYMPGFGDPIMSLSSRNVALRLFEAQTPS